MKHIKKFNESDDFNIKKFNVSTERNIDDYFTELKESDLGRIEITDNIINVYFTHDVHFNDVGSELDTDSRTEVCMREMEYFKLLKKTIGELIVDFDVKIQPHSSKTHIVLTLIDKNLKTFYEIKSDKINIYSSKLKEIIPGIKHILVFNAQNRGELEITYLNKEEDLSKVNSDIAKLNLPSIPYLQFEANPQEIAKMVNGKPYYGIKIITSKNIRKL